nr:hypothetical protein [Tanacetum cinerariifolium]
MLDRTNFASWKQCIRLYCRGKENGVNILKSIDEGAYQMGTVQETLAEITDGAPQFGLPKDIYTLINHYTDAKDIWDNHKGEFIHDYYVWFAKLINDMRNIKMTMSRMQLNSKFVNIMLPEWGRFVTAVKLNKGLKDSNYDQLAHSKELYSTKATIKLLILQRQDVANADECDAFDSDVDEAPTAQTMFMANLSFADPITDEARPSYDSDILSEVQDHDHYQDAVCAHHEEHAMHDSVQLDHAIDSHADYTSDSNMIPYDQYVMDNEVPVVHSNVSFVLNDAFMMIYNDMCEPHAQSISNPSRNTVVKNSLTAELATYKEQFELYERRAKFELTKREQKINEQLRIIISDQEVTFLKKDFKQKENKYLEDFLDMKSLKEKNKVAIGYKNPLWFTRAKQVQPFLYNGHDIIKDNHAPPIVHNTKDTLEIAEITKKKMNDKMKDPGCVTRKVKIAPHDYSKENFLATFTPQTQLTPEQIFWSNDLIKLKSKALKEQTTVSRPIKALTV